MKKGKRRIGDPWGLRHFSLRGEPRGLGILGALLPEEFLLSCWAWHNTLDDTPVPGGSIQSRQNTILPWIAIFINSSGIGRRVADARPNTFPGVEMSFYTPGSVALVTQRSRTL